MASRYEVEVTIELARDLKNVNWRKCDLNLNAVAWVDPATKCSTKANVDGDDDTNPIWDDKLTISLPHDLPLDNVVHAGAAADSVKPLASVPKP